MQQRYVIIGASLAGGTAALTLQDEEVDLRSHIPGAKPARTHQRRIILHAVARPGDDVK